MVADGTEIFYKVILSLKQPSKTPFWTSKPIVQNFDPSKIYFSSLVPFFISNFQSHLIKVVPVDHTDHFGFRLQSQLYGKTLPKFGKWGTTHF